MGTREKIEVPMYEGNLNLEEIIDWISALNKYFDRGSRCWLSDERVYSSAL
jgi:hypothetical protein